MALPHSQAAHGSAPLVPQRLVAAPLLLLLGVEVVGWEIQRKSEAAAAAEEEAAAAAEVAAEGEEAMALPAATPRLCRAGTTTRFASSRSTWRAR